MQRPNTTQRIPHEIKQSYQFAVQNGLAKLKRQFLIRYFTVEHTASLRRLEIRHITDILHPSPHKKLRQRQAKTLGTHPQHLNKIRQEISLVLQQKTDRLLASRSSHELYQRAHGPFFETEAYLSYLNWLELGDFPDSLPERLWPTSQTARFEWQGDPVGINRLYELLQLEQLIDSKFSIVDFMAHFQEGNQSLKPIRWRASNLLLLYLAAGLMEHGFLPDIYYHNLVSLLPLHFLDKSGGLLKPNSLSVLRSKSHKAPRGAERIDRLLERLTQT